MFSCEGCRLNEKPAPAHFNVYIVTPRPGEGGTSPVWARARQKNPPDPVVWGLRSCLAAGGGLEGKFTRPRLRRAQTRWRRQGGEFTPPLPRRGQRLACPGTR